jgi:hypothetical protein
LREGERETRRETIQDERPLGSINEERDFIVFMISLTDLEGESTHHNQKREKA